MWDVDTVIALAGALFGGVLLEITRRILTRPDRQSLSQQILSEGLRADVRELRAALATAEAHADVWEERFYQIREEYLAFRELVIGAVTSEQVDTIRTRAEQIGRRRRTAHHRDGNTHG